MRRKVIAGNWKMNKLPNEAINFIDKLIPLVKNSEAEVILCVPYIDIFYSTLTAQKTNIKIGAQNMHYEETGAYTGEVSPSMLKSVGIEYVIIGHSERRTYYNETDEDVNKKIKSAFANGLKPIVCVGETLEERESGKAFDVLKEQTTKLLEGISAEDAKKIILAYEPVWAIGTGKTATDEQANEACGYIRSLVKELLGEEVAEAMRILYGGSVNAGNVKALMSMSDIDGALVGGASLKADFVTLVNYKEL